MPKKIQFESARHHILTAVRELVIERVNDSGKVSQLAAAINSWSFKYEGGKKLTIIWNAPIPGTLEVDFSEARLYSRGDSAGEVQNDQDNSEILAHNHVIFRRIAETALNKALDNL